MKRTTYILIGLLITGLGVIITTVVVVSFLGKDYEEANAYLGGEQQEMSLKGVQAIEMFVTQGEVTKPRYITILGDLLITSASAPDQAKISYSKNQYIKVSKKDDKLLVEFDFNEYNIPERFKHKGWLSAIGVDMHLMIDTAMTEIVSRVDGLKLNLKDIKADSLSLEISKQDVRLDSCQFRSFKIQGKNRFGFHANDGEIENFYLNMDGVSNWTFQYTKIGTQYLSGSGHHTNDLQKGECRRVVWTPLKEDARLEMKIREKAEIIIEPE